MSYIQKLLTPIKTPVVVAKPLESVPATPLPFYLNLDNNSEWPSLSSSSSSSSSHPPKRTTPHVNVRPSSSSIPAQEIKNKGQSLYQEQNKIQQTSSELEKKRPKITVYDVEEEIQDIVSSTLDGSYGIGGINLTNFRRHTRRHVMVHYYMDWAIAAEADYIANGKSILYNDERMPYDYNLFHHLVNTISKETSNEASWVLLDRWFHDFDRDIPILEDNDPGVDCPGAALRSRLKSFGRFLRR